MSETDAVERMDESGTMDLLAADLRVFDVEHGDTLPAHSSLSLLGWVVGGPQAVADTLQTVLTSDRTLVILTHTGQYIGSSVWENPPVSDDWVEVIGESMPPFRPDVTPARGTGTVPECFRNYPGVVRNEHSTVSFAAWSAAAEEIVSDHELNYGFGNGSPLARVYDHGGDVLLLDVGRGNDTPFHLVEHHADFEKTQTRERTPLLRDGGCTATECDDIEVETDDFEAVGEAFERQRGAVKGPVAAAAATLLDRPALVDFVEDWFESNR